MKRYLAFGTLALLLASAAAVGGYWLGFRHGSQLALMADAAPRGALAVGLIHQLDNGKADSVRFYLESEVDSGLMWWDELDRWPLRRFLNPLFGSDVIPGDEAYIRRIVSYRKEHPSPLDEAGLNQQMIEHIRESDPAMAKELDEGLRAKRRAAQEMLRKYGQQQVGSNNRWRGP